MGAEQSRPTTKVTKGNKRKSEVVVDAGISSTAKKRQRTARRKSTGRSERKSLLPDEAAAIAKEVASESASAALHNNIDENLQDSERLKKLFDGAFEASASWAETGTEAENRDDFLALARDSFQKWSERIEKADQWEKATEKVVLRPNPKNIHMKETLELYNNTAKRLEAEIVAWKEATTVKADKKSSKKKANEEMQAEAAVNDSEPGGGEIMEGAEFQIEAIERFVEQCNTMLKNIEERHANDSKEIANTRFSNYADIEESPKKIIKSLDGES